MQKKETENTEEETSEEDRKRKNNRRTSVQKVLEVEESFGKEKSERIPTRKPWDYTIELKKGFVLKKGKMYSLSREKREKVQAFVENQL